jgi:hypothetical protein
VTINNPRSAGHGRLKRAEQSQREKDSSSVQAARPQLQASHPRTASARSARAGTAEDGALVGGLARDHVEAERLRLRLQQHLEHLLALLRQALLAACALLGPGSRHSRAQLALPARLSQVAARLGLHAFAQPARCRACAARPAQWP